MLYTVISGTKFNDKYKNKVFYKFLDRDQIHNGFQYTQGLNTNTNTNIDINTNTDTDTDTDSDNQTSNPISKDLEGEHYFYEQSECWRFWNTYGNLQYRFKVTEEDYQSFLDTKLSLVEIPNDAMVYIGDHKFKADKIILTKIIDFDSAPENLWSNILIKDIGAFRYVKKEYLTENICKTVITNNGLALREPCLKKYITEELCIAAVEQNGLAIVFVPKKYLTYTICKLAVEQNGFALAHIKEEYLTEELCLLAVKQNECVLHYIKNQTENIYKLAVQKIDNCKMELTVG